MRGKHFEAIMAVIFILSIPASVLSQEGRGMGRISGTVVDEAGNPVGNAEIVIQARSYEYSTKTMSDKNGNWAVAGLGTGIFSITASKEGYLPTAVEMNVSQFKNPLQKITLKRIQDISEPSVDDENSRKLFEEANAMYNQENYKSALALFEEFLEKNPRVYMIRFNIGNCYREMKEYEKALVEYNLVLEKLKEVAPEPKSDQNQAKVYASIGEVYLIQNEFSKAQEYLKKAVDLFPSDHALAYNVAEIFFQAGQVDQAIEYYTLSSKIKPDWPNAWLKLGYAHVNKGNFEEAIKYFQKFLDSAPQDPQAESIRNLIDQLKKR
ncbi:MAG: tetratricopeptide repeat protein [Candidatus Aminicenantales bacterium]